eukprot:2178605-Rhodomonas_salina.1
MYCCRSASLCVDFSQLTHVRFALTYPVRAQAVEALAYAAALLKHSLELHVSNVELLLRAVDFHVDFQADGAAAES